MNNRDLERSWAVTRKHLAQAFSTISEHNSSSYLKEYKEFLEYNELGLAACALQNFAEETDCNQEFWTQLLAAAKNMDVQELIIDCEKQLAKSA